MNLPAKIKTRAERRTTFDNLAATCWQFNAKPISICIKFKRIFGEFPNRDDFKGSKFSLRWRKAQYSNRNECDLLRDGKTAAEVVAAIPMADGSKDETAGAWARGGRK